MTTAKNSLVSVVHPGVTCWKNRHNITVLRLHYEADEAKSQGEKIYVPEIDRELSPWAFKEYSEMPDRSMYLQEYEIDFGATLGQLLYPLDKEATLVHSSAMPTEGTDYFALDPHPVVPFASLWARADRWGDLWIYRELWPSSVAFRYEDGRLYGQKGNIPENDFQHTIREYVETVWWLESEQNPENKGKPTDVWKRVIDYAARAFGKGTQDDPEQPNFQQRIATHASELRREKGIEWKLEFEDAKKDLDVGRKEVNAWLKPRQVRDATEDKWTKQSRIRICQDRCPELIYQMETNRRKKLTPLQAETQDPSAAAIQKRNHLTDCLRYLVMMLPSFRKPEEMFHEYEPPVRGLSY